MDIQDLIKPIRQQRIRITDHADDEAQADKLTFDEILVSVLEGEIIEDYPSDRSCPSCLIYGLSFQGDPIHSVWTYNQETRWAVLITVYRPDPKRWINWRERKKIMKAFDKCPVCEWELPAKIKAMADVCLQCGQRLYQGEDVRRFEQIRQKLAAQDVKDFQLLGQSYQVA